MRALHSTLLAHMSPLVRPTPSADYLGAQPAVAALAVALRNVLVADMDGRVVTPVAHLVNAPHPPVVWDALQGCYYVHGAALADTVPVTHLNAFPACLILCVQSPNAGTK